MENNWLLSAVERVAPGMSSVLNTSHTGELYPLTPAESRDPRILSLQEVAAPARLVGILYDDAHCCPLFMLAPKGRVKSSHRNDETGEDDYPMLMEGFDSVAVPEGKLVKLSGGTSVVRVDEERAYIAVAASGAITVLHGGEAAGPRPVSICSVESAIRRRTIEAKAAFCARSDMRDIVKRDFQPITWYDDCEIDEDQQKSLDTQLKYHQVPSSSEPKVTQSETLESLKSPVEGVKRPYASLAFYRSPLSPSTKEKTGEKQRKSARTLDTSALTWLQPRLRLHADGNSSRSTTESAKERQT